MICAQLLWKETGNNGNAMIILLFYMQIICTVIYCVQLFSLEHKNHSIIDSLVILSNYEGLGMLSDILRQRGQPLDVSALDLLQLLSNLVQDS